MSTPSVQDEPTVDPFWWEDAQRDVEDTLALLIQYARAEASGFHALIKGLDVAMHIDEKRRHSIPSRSLVTGLAVVPSRSSVNETALRDERQSHNQGMAVRTLFASLGAAHPHGYARRLSEVQKSVLESTAKKAKGLTGHGVAWLGVAVLGMARARMSRKEARWSQLRSLSTSRVRTLMCGSSWTRSTISFQMDASCRIRRSNRSCESDATIRAIGQSQSTGGKWSFRNAACFSTAARPSGPDSRH